MYKMERVYPMVLSKCNANLSMRILYLLWKTVSFGLMVVLEESVSDTGIHPPGDLNTVLTENAMKIWILLLR